MKKLHLNLILALISFCSSYSQEARVETFAGNNGLVLDAFWVEPFSKGSRFLFTNRNTFHMQGHENQPGHFSTLNILTYQIKKSGFGLAAIATANTNSPVQARGGIQYFKIIPGKLLLNAVLSAKIGSSPDTRGLIILQHTPELNERLDFFFRTEWITSFGFKDQHKFSASLFRIGLQINTWQFGPGSEFLWTGRKFSINRQNYGLFLTKVF